jgi:tetratricopeptide (TPR) repeat protein
MRFHAAFGKLTTRGYFCSQVAELRQRLVDAIRSAQESTEIHNLALEEIQLLIKSELPLEGRLVHIRTQHQEYQIQKNQNLVELWEQIEKMLSNDEYISILEFIMIKGRTQDFKLNFDRVVSDHHQELAAHIQGTPIEVLYRDYQQLAHEEFNWATLEDDEMIEDYVNQRIAPLRAELSTVEIHIMALVFGITITLTHPNDAALPPFNPGRELQVHIQHDGGNHYQRLIELPTLLEGGAEELSKPPEIYSGPMSVLHPVFATDREHVKALLIITTRLKLLSFTQNFLTCILNKLMTLSPDSELGELNHLENELRYILGELNQPISEHIGFLPDVQFFYIAVLYAYLANCNPDEAERAYCVQARSIIDDIINRLDPTNRNPADWDPEICSRVKVNAIAAGIGTPPEYLLYQKPILGDYFYLRSFLKQLAKDPDYIEDRSWAHYHYGITLSLYGAHHRACEHFALSLEQSPTDFKQQICLEYSHSLWSQGDWQKAIEIYEEGISCGIINNVFLQLLYRAAQAHYIRGHFPKAKQLAEQFLFQLPKAESSDPLLYQVTGLGAISPTAIGRENHLLKIRILLTRLAYHAQDLSDWIRHCEAACEMATIEDANWSYYNNDLLYQADDLLCHCLTDKNTPRLLAIIRIVVKIHRKNINNEVFPFFAHRRKSEGEKQEASPPLSPTSYLRLLSYYISLICSPQLAELIDLKKITESAKLLIEEIDSKSKYFSADIPSITKALQEMMNRKKIPDALTLERAPVDKVLIRKGYAQLSQAQMAPQDSANHWYQCWCKAGAIIMLFYRPKLQEIQFNACTLNHEAYLAYLHTELDRLHVKLICLIESSTPEKYPTVITLLDHEYSRCLYQLDQYQLFIDKRNISKEVRTYQSDSLLVLYYQIYRLRILILDRHFLHYQQTEQYAFALEVCTEAVGRLKHCIKLGARQVPSNWLLSATQPAMQSEQPHLFEHLIAIKNRECKLKLNDMNELLEVNERKRKRLVEQMEIDPLTVYYGKKQIPIPFFYHPMPKPAQIAREPKPLRDKVCLAIGSLTILYSNGSEFYSRNIRLNYDHSQELISTLTEISKSSNWFKETAKITARLIKGRAIALQKRAAYKDIPLKFFDHNDTIGLENFDIILHLHAEHVLFSLLNQQDTTELIKRFKAANPTFTPNCKVLSVSLDFEIENTMCACCKLGTLAMQSEDDPNYFLPKLKVELVKQGYKLPKQKRDAPQLTCFTRVLGDKYYNNKVNHDNPSRDNVKENQNLGIFETTVATVAASGCRKTLYKL